MDVMLHVRGMTMWTVSKPTQRVLFRTFLIIIWLSSCSVQLSVQDSDTEVTGGSSLIRLVNGPTPYDGRVEVFHDNVWGTVCDDMWDLEEAKVVCRQLGYNDSIDAVKGAFFGSGKGPIMMDNVQCIGNETELTDCKRNDWYDHNCAHYEDAGVVCEWKENTVRLRHDTGKREAAGRVEIYKSGTWGTICDNQWDIDDAEVVCRQAGFATAAQVIPTTEFNTPQGPIALSDVQCIGNEENLIDCTHSGWYSHSCPNGHEQDAGVTCFDDINEHDLRLIDENIHDDNYDSGRVQIFINETWGSICSEGWNYNDAQVVCRQLGYAHAEHVSPVYEGEFKGPMYITSVDCKGDEAKLVDCLHSKYISPTCRESNETYVSCQGPRVRLSGGTTPYEGRVEVLHHGKWGTVCSHNWDMTNSNLICNQLGYDGAISFTDGDVYGVGTDPIMLSNVACDSLDDYLSECIHDGWFVHQCDHNMDVEVTCSPGPVYRVRLDGSNASSDFEGRVEMFFDGAWGTVCDYGWDMADADVVCKELGYSRALQSLGGAYFGEGDGQILMDNVTCNDYVEHLSHCAHLGWYQHDECTHADDAGVVCDPGDETPVKLVNHGNTGSIYEGKVELFQDGRWKSVCGDSDWDVLDAKVICRQLFLSEDNAVVALNISRPSDINNHLSEMTCSGWEFSLADCEYNEWITCSTNFDGGVVCVTPLTVRPRDGDIRLVDGTRATEGRVEIYHEGIWGTICDTNWDIYEAEVVCKQLGYPDTFRATSGSAFGFGSGTILLDSMDCIGFESRLEYCTHDDWGVHTCDVTKEAGAECGVADGTLRLVHGNNMYEGRVEIHYRGVWGTICDIMWGLTDAEVACHQLGYEEALNVYHGSHFGEGTGPVLLDYVSCYGYENRIDECPRGGWYDTDCDHSRDAGVKCTNPDKTEPDNKGFNILLLLGLLLALLCMLLWCYKPCCKLIQKRRQSHADRALSEVSYPNNFSDFESLHENDLPTYQDATRDLPPDYECLYGQDETETENNGIDNPRQLTQGETLNVIDNDNTDLPDQNVNIVQNEAPEVDGAHAASGAGHTDGILNRLTETEIHPLNDLVSENILCQHANEDKHSETGLFQKDSTEGHERILLSEYNPEILATSDIDSLGKQTGASASEIDDFSESAFLQDNASNITCRIQEHGNTAKNIPERQILETMENDECFV